MKSIKFLALSLMAIVATSGVAFAIDNPRDPGEIKAVRGQDQATPTKVYKLVRYVRNGVNDVSVVSGDALVYSLVSDDGVSVNLTTTSADGAFAGIAVTAIPSSDSLTTQTAVDDIGRRNWGYIQVHGPVWAKTGVGGTNDHSAGDAFITSTDSGAITGFQTTAATTTVTVAAAQDLAGVGGFFMDGDSSDTLMEVFVRAE